MMTTQTLLVDETLWTVSTFTAKFILCQITDCFLLLNFSYKLILSTVWFNHKTFGDSSLGQRNHVTSFWSTCRKYVGWRLWKYQFVNFYLLGAWNWCSGDGYVNVWDNHFYYQKHKIKLLVNLYFVVLLYQVCNVKKCFRNQNSILELITCTLKNYIQFVYW